MQPPPKSPRQIYSASILFDWLWKQGSPRLQPLLPQTQISHKLLWLRGIETLFFSFPPQDPVFNPHLRKPNKETRAAAYLVSLIDFLNSLVIGALKPPFLSKESIVWI